MLLIIKKTYYVEQILIYISKIIEYFGIEKIKLKNDKQLSTTINKRKTKGKNKRKNTATVNIKVNQSNIIKGIFKELLKDIIWGTLKLQQMEIFIDEYVKIIKNETNRSFVRESNQPFKKWYVKKYHEQYKNKEILNAIETDTTNNLHKNLKVKCKNVKM